MPSITDLSEQLERCDLINMDKKIKDYKKTDLKQYVELLEKFVGRLEKTWREKSLLESDLKGAIEGEF